MSRRTRSKRTAAVVTEEEESDEQVASDQEVAFGDEVAASEQEGGSGEEDGTSDEREEVVPSSSARNFINNELQEADSADPVLSFLNFATDQILKVQALTKDCYPGDIRKTAREKAKADDAVMEILKSELAYKRSKNVIIDVAEELNLKEHDGDEPSFFDGVDSIETLSHQRIAEYSDSLTTEDLLGCPEYIRVQNQIIKIKTVGASKVDETSEEEEEETEAEVDLEAESVDTEGVEVIPELDPISKEPLRDPVRNRLCRHIYGKASILKLIKSNPRTKCPAMGCQNQIFVKAAHLEHDPELTAKIKKTGSSGGAIGRTAAAASKSRRGRRRRR